MPILTEQEEVFAFGIFEGLSQRKAYRRAYKKSRTWKDATVDSKACVLAGSDKIQERVQELKKEANSERILSFQQIQEMLSDKAREQLNNEGLKAIDILNRMAGHYEKDNKRTVEGTVDANVKVIDVKYS